MRFTDTHQQALELDLWILSSTLSHGRASHRRTIHFQRLEMAKACFLRYGLNELYTEWNEFTASLKSRPSEESAQSKGESEVKNKGEQGSKAIVDASTDDPTIELHRAKLQNLLHDRLIIGTTEFSSRSLHASKYGMVEMARGFFLPFLTVSFASLARLRVLAIQLQHQIKLVDIPALLEDPAIGMLRKDLERLGDAIPLEKLAMRIYDTPMTDQETYERSLASLGLSRSKLKQTNDKEFSTTYSKKKRRCDKESLRDKSDIGEALTFKKVKGAAASPATDQSAMRVDPLDNNAECLKVLRKKKAKKKRATSAEASARERRSKNDTAEEQTPPAEVQKKKRAKKKKTGGGDFFDELFG